MRGRGVCEWRISWACVEERVETGVSREREIGASGEEGKAEEGRERGDWRGGGKDEREREEGDVRRGGEKSVEAPEPHVSAVSAKREVI